MESVIYLFESEPVIFSAVAGLIAVVILLLFMTLLKSGKTHKQLRSIEQLLRKNVSPRADDSLKVFDKVFKSLHAQNNKNYALIEAAFKETAALKKLIGDMYHSVEKQINDMKIESAGSIDGLVSRIGSNNRDGF